MCGFSWVWIYAYQDHGQSLWPCIWACLCCALGAGTRGTPLHSAAGLLEGCLPGTSDPSSSPKPPELWWGHVLFISLEMALVRVLYHTRQKHLLLYNLLSSSTFSSSLFLIFSATSFSLNPLLAKNFTRYSSQVTYPERDSGQIYFSLHQKQSRVDMCY